ncbi:MAG: hypothetical protein AB9M53_00370 [Leptothrix sp. (in: b-proteobacteria)]
MNPDLIVILATAGLAALAVWAFWLLYVICMAFYAAKLEGNLVSWNLYMAAPVLVVGLLFDVAFQYLVATFWFQDWPAKGEHLVTQRLQRYRTSEPDSWRGARAKRICELRLNPFDPRRKHC